MNAAWTLTAPQTKTPLEEAPLCLPLATRYLPDRLTCTDIPWEADQEALCRALLAAPAFSQVPPALTAPREQLRVIFLCEELFYARQCAATLCALVHRNAPTLPEDDPLQALFDQLEPTEEDVSRVLMTAPADRLAPRAEAGPTPFSCPAPAPLDTSDLRALLLTGEGEPPTAELADHLAVLEVRDLFLALRPWERDRALMERLIFEQGFVLCPIGENDLPYQCRLLAACIRQAGVHLAKDADLVQVVRGLRNYRGERFSEYDFVTLAQRARAAGRGPFTAQQLIPRSWREEGASGRQELEALIGLEGVKDQLRRVLARQVLERRRALAGQPVEPSCRHLAFAGPPGTCKSMAARLTARVLREEGCGTGAFVEVGREQLIGGYLGQTSHLVAEAFQKARGGVLFVDEAGALLTAGDRDIYAQEAIRALVRHMELHPETMVIFAGYPADIRQLLAADPGLSSRVARVIDFPPCGDGQLCDILDYLARRRGYRLPEGWRDVCAPFFSRLRRRRGEGFGNGREARRLLEAAVEELALRAAEAPDAPDTPLDALSLADLEGAADGLLAADHAPVVRPIGFVRREEE